MNKSLQVTKLTLDTKIEDNVVQVNPVDIGPEHKYLHISTGIVDSIVNRTDTRNMIPGKIGLNLLQRQLLDVREDQTVNVVPYTRRIPRAVKMDIAIEELRKGKKRMNTNTLAYNDESQKDDLVSLKHIRLSSYFKKNFEHLVFSTRGYFAIKLDGNTLICSVRHIVEDNGTSIEYGVFAPYTIMGFSVSPGCRDVQLTENEAMTLFKTNIDLEELGIGGLNKEFNSIFRRAFASRVYPPEIVQRLGVQHVKGMLLYGPPGTGKTLIARKIGEMLKAKPPKIVSGPEVMSKYVGQSEENVRKLFEDAQAEYKQKGDHSELHIIIMDELDAICKQRGSRSGDTGVGDSVVNQLLAKMDGVEQLNNILIIGMTNRKDMIDDALLRPGRLEMHIEIGLPDEEGRLQILKIHTNKMRNNDILDNDVSLDDLVEHTKNYSGAELEGLVKAASSYAFARNVKMETGAGVSTDLTSMKVNMHDFTNALGEIQPAFGADETELDQAIQNGIIHYSTIIEDILKDGRLFVEQVRNSERTPLVSVLLHGSTGSGKTALAATIAKESQFPFIQLISPENMVGLREDAKVNAINRTFNDSYKSPLSVIIIDDIERLLEYVPIGPRFSNHVLQALLVLLKKKPPVGRRLLIIATTSNQDTLYSLGMAESFSAELFVPTITNLKELKFVLEFLEVFESDDLENVLQRLEAKGLNRLLSMGIKRLLTVIEMAAQDEDRVEKFINMMQFDFAVSTLSTDVLE